MLAEATTSIKDCDREGCVEQSYALMAQQVRLYVPTDTFASVVSSSGWTLGETRPTWKAIRGSARAGGNLPIWGVWCDGFVILAARPSLLYCADLNGYKETLGVFGKILKLAVGGIVLIFIIGAIVGPKGSGTTSITSQSSVGQPQAK